MKIEKNKVVSIEYTLTDEAGTILDSSGDKGALPYIHGQGNLIPGLEKALEGKTEGDAFQATIEPKDAYGEHSPNLLVEVPRSNFEAGTPIEVGMRFEAGSGGGSQVVRVVKVDDNTVTIDANHELAGKTLVFDVKVISVREATEEELYVPTGGCSCGSSSSGCGSSGCGTGGCSCF